MVTRVSRVLAALLVLGTATSVTAQGFNSELNRYRTAKIECEEAYRRHLERPRNGCTGACERAGQNLKDRCLARAERAYGEALRRALRIRR